MVPFLSPPQKKKKKNNAHKHTHARALFPTQMTSPRKINIEKD